MRKRPGVFPCASARYAKGPRRERWRGRSFLVGSHPWLDERRLDNRSHRRSNRWSQKFVRSYARRTKSKPRTYTSKIELGQRLGPPLDLHGKPAERDERGLLPSSHANLDANVAPRLGKIPAGEIETRWSVRGEESRDEQGVAKRNPSFADWLRP